MADSVRKSRHYGAGERRPTRDALRRAAEMLLRLGPDGAWELLQTLGNGDSPGKAQAEIVNPGAN